MHTTTKTLNDIPAEQAKLGHVKLIRARDRTYQSAKLTQGCFITLSIGLPIASVVLAPTFPNLKPYFAMLGLALLLIDVGILDRLQKDRIKRGAKLQEEFDTKVLQLPWNRFVAGTVVDHEDVRAASARRLPEERETQISCWYEPCVAEVPIHLARLICQRTNISYDSRLRRKYGNWLLNTTVTLFLVLMFFGLVFELSLSEMLLTVLVPFTPFANWVLREYRKQVDTAASLATLKAEFEKLWEKALANTSPEELKKGSRELQDAIYQHRASNPLVFDWVYYRLRNRNEDEARHAAQELVQQAQSTPGLGEGTA